MNDEELSKLTSVELLKHGESLIEEHGRTIRMHSEIMNADELKVGDIAVFSSKKLINIRKIEKDDIENKIYFIDEYFKLTWAREHNFRKAIAEDWHNTKIKVDTPEKSKLVQELLFSYGIEWKSRKRYLFVDEKELFVYHNRLKVSATMLCAFKEVFFSDLYPDYKERPKNILKIPIKDRTQKEHLRIMNDFHNGNIRDYLLKQLGLED